MELHYTWAVAEALLFGGSVWGPVTWTTFTSAPPESLVIAVAVSKASAQVAFRLYHETKVEFSKQGQIHTYLCLRNRVFFQVSNFFERVNSEACSSSSNSTSRHTDFEIVFGTIQPFDLFRNVVLSIWGKAHQAVCRDSNHLICDRSKADDFDCFLLNIRSRLRINGKKCNFVPEIARRCQPTGTIEVAERQ